MSQEALAESAGLSRRGIADLERGARRSPYPDTVRRLADALGLDPIERRVLVDACRPRAAARHRRHSLPVEPTPIVGRTREIDHLRKLVAGSRLLTLTGIGGIGKTRLAVELAHRIESDHADGAVVIDLAPMRDLGEVQAALGRGLGVSSGPGKGVTDNVVRYLEPRRLLLVLDNCEHVAASCAELAQVLLRASPGLALVVTSREALRVPGEVVWPVPPLAADESVDLFVQRAQAAGAAGPRTPRELELVAAITDRLEGIPLAIELTVAWVPSLGLPEVERRISDRLGFLSRGGRLEVPRHRTLRAALDWSWELLAADEQRLFPRLAVFAGGWTLQAAEQVCSGDGLSSAGVVDGLAGLMEKSLVWATDDDVQRRFRLLDTVREYAFERLSDSSDAEAVVARHAQYFRDMVDDGAVTRLGLRYPADAARVGQEHANFTAALSALFDREELAPGVALCEALGGFWLAQGFLREGQEWLARFLMHPEELSPQALAGGLHTWGRLAEYSGDLDSAQDLFERSLSASRVRADRKGAARALCGLGDVSVHHGLLNEARASYVQALRLTEKDGTGPEHAQSLLCLGRVDSARGDLESSSQWLEKALGVQRRAGDPWGVAYALNELGQQARRSGQLTKAQSLLEECHVLWRQTGTRMGERAAVMNLTLVVLELGSIARAGELAHESLVLTDAMHDDASAATVRCVEIAALVLAARGSTPTAVGLVAAATRRREILGAPRPSAEGSELAPVLTRARTALGAERFGIAWRRGLDLLMIEALEVARAALERRAGGMARKS